MSGQHRKGIRRLSFKSLWASRKRNIIAICAIALTTLMFTSLFTIMLSVNSSYETYNFRQAGGYSDGSFKDLSREQADKIAAHKGIKASGERIVCGFSSSDVFGKVAAEVSYMDKNCTKWSYATPTTGKEPQKENEIAMDTTALRLLGVEPKLGTNVTITYQAGNGTDTGIPQTDSFILVGYWEYDDLMPVHYINVSKAYVDKINEKCIAAGDEALDIDLNVMLPSKLNIREQMESGSACQCCGKPLIQPRTGRPRKFCSDKCRRDWWAAHTDRSHPRESAMYTTTCAYCGQEFRAYGNSKRKYCCHACYIRDRFWRAEDGRDPYRSPSAQTEGTP